MAKPLGNYKYQINMFSGAQSYILRTNTIKEIKDFTGKKKITSDVMQKYLNDLKWNDGLSFYDGDREAPDYPLW